EAFLLGRRTYQWLAARWPSRTGALADRLNGMPKYVVSGTLGQPAWGGTTVLRGDALTEVAALRRRLAGDIVVPGSFLLVRGLMERGVVDELRLRVFRVVRGAGSRIFGATSDMKQMRLTGVQAVDGGIAVLTYQPASPGSSGDPSE